MLSINCVNKSDCNVTKNTGSGAVPSLTNVAVWLARHGFKYIYKELWLQML